MAPSLWETVGMSEKRTKADKAQRQSDQLEKKARHPAPKKKKKAPRIASLVSLKIQTARLPKLQHMPKRKLRLVKRVPPILGVCEACNTTFKSIHTDPAAAVADIKVGFDAHKCKREDASQAAARIVKEATEER